MNLKCAIFFLLMICNPCIYANNEKQDEVKDISALADKAFEEAIKDANKNIIYVIQEILKKHSLKVTTYKYDEIFINKGDIRINLHWTIGNDWTGCEIILKEDDDGLQEVSFQLYTM